MSELRFGLTAEAPCSYLPEQQEQLVFLLPDQPINAQLYQQLMQLNFRRSADQVYTPYCQSCRACQSVRIAPENFRPNAGQRRILNKARRNNWRAVLTSPQNHNYFQLFSDYICHKHADGSMFPPDPQQLGSMLNCSWLNVRVLELYYQQKLAAVCIVDETEQAFSAVYTFYSPELSRFSPGILAILFLLENAASHRKNWLYLGYQIANCNKMAYKADFLPQQRFIDGNWHSFG